MKLSDERLNEWLACYESMFYCAPSTEQELSHNHNMKVVCSIIQELKLARELIDCAECVCSNSSSVSYRKAKKAYEAFGKEVSDGNQAEGD